MPYTTPTTAVEDVAYTADDMNVLVNNDIYMYAQRPMAGSVFSNSAWNLTAADSTFEDDTDANAKVEITTIATCSVIVQWTALVNSNTVRDESITMRAKCGASYSTDCGFAGIADANNRVLYAGVARFASVGAGTLTIRLSAAQAESDDDLTIGARYICVLCIPE